MTKVSNYLMLMAFFITLGAYRVPILGYNISIYHMFLAGALFLSVTNVLQKRGQIQINKETRIPLGVFILFIIYSFLTFLRNIGVMYPESRSGFLAEMLGYIMVILIGLFVTQRRKLQKITTAFLASGAFVYLGSLYTLFLWVTRREYVIGAPFWFTFSRSKHVIEYLQSATEFMLFPRFRLPFSTPAGTGIFLSLSGIFLLTFLLQRVANKRKGSWWLILLNAVNFFCLLGTFARASWAVYTVGSLVVMWCFRKYKLVSFGRVIMTYLIVAVLLFLAISSIPLGDKFAHKITLRFSPRYTEQSNIGHLESRLLALHYWTERPFLGLGVGGFWLKPGGGIHTHSTYFTLLVNRGLVGLLIFLIFYSSLYRLLKKKIRIAWEGRNEFGLIYGIALLGGLSGLVVGHFLYQMDTAVVWLYYGLVLAYANLPVKEEPHDEEGFSAKRGLKRIS